MSEFQWDASKRPPRTICPRRFCFSWIEAGDLYALGFYADVDQALQHLVKAEHGQCGWTLGTCTRLDQEHGDGDFYEPDEPALARAGLPWFYFCDPRALVEEFQERYLVESRELWGDDA